MTVSPCRNICQLDATGQICLGCGRTLDEIAGWAAMTERQRLQVMQRLDSAPAPGQLKPTQQGSGAQSRGSGPSGDQNS